MEMYRCFVAIDLPEDVKEHLAQIQAALRVWNGRVKWVEKRNFHLTLKFLGEISLSQVKSAKEGLEEAVAAIAPFRLAVDRLGAFPNLQKPKVIWVGIHDPEGSLAKLQAGIEEHMVKRGFSPEPKRFSPHLTLGRVKETVPPADLADVIKKVAVPEIIIPVREVKLMRSQLHRDGPVYSCLASYNF